MENQNENLNNLDLQFRNNLLNMIIDDLYRKNKNYFYVKNQVYYDRLKQTLLEKLKSCPNDVLVRLNKDLNLD